MAQHAVLSPSGAEKWMNCAGAPAMEKGLPDDANDYSDEGTAAHLLGSTCLEKGTNPADYVGRTIYVGANDEFDGAVWKEDIGDDFYAGFVIRRTYVVDDDMAAHVAKYVDAVREYTKGGTMVAEQRVSISMFTGEEGAAGTSDAAGVLPGELQVHDLKFGMGVKVYADHNKQLMIYALGVREEMDFAFGPFERYRFIIHQPRIDHVSEWDCTAAELDAFAEEVKAAAAKALKLYADDDADLNVGGRLKPGQDTCRWCKAKAICPALAKFVQDATASDFTALPMLYEDGPKPVPSDPELLSRKMAAIPLIEDWCKAIRAKLEQQLFAGVAIPGWKIVQGKRGNQSWTDEAAADALLKKMRMPVEERCNLSLKSPTQIQKLLKAEPKRLARVLKANLIGQRDGQPSVAPESDKRPAWTPPDTANDFTATAEEALA